MSRNNENETRNQPIGSAPPPPAGPPPRSIFESENRSKPDANGNKK